MAKILLIDCCGECKYFNVDKSVCWHSEAPAHDELDIYDIPEWCPLPDVESEE
jgi:hypothetical protein